MPAGEFIYGGDGRFSEEHLTLSLDGFWIDRLEVSNQQFFEFVLEADVQEPAYWSSDQPDAEVADLPVYGVSWENANAFCRSQGKRLPTEEEWEKAARGIDGRFYPWGNDEHPSKCNVYESRDRPRGYAQTPSCLDPVDSHPAGASPYGAYNMTGNVWEWTSTPMGRGGHILRGGSCGNYIFDVPVTRRQPSDYRDLILTFVGFRCAADG